MWRKEFLAALGTIGHRQRELVELTAFCKMVFTDRSKGLQPLLSISSGFPNNPEVSM
jgi:hypothetical protein